MMRRFLASRVFAACVASAITAVVVGGVAFAMQSPVDSGGVIHACYSAKSGDLRLDVNGACTRSRSTALTDIRPIAPVTAT